MSTSSNAIDIGLLGAFLFATLILGIQAGRRVASFRIFAVGDKDFSTATLSATIVSTWISGGFFLYTLSHVYTKGLHFVISIAGTILCLLIIGRMIAARMGEFMNNLSVAEAMGDMYGPLVRIITAVTGILGRVGYLAVQFQVIGKMLNFMLALEGPTAIIIAAGIVIFYSAFGGVRSVTITDILQFLTFNIFIPVLVLIIWSKLEDSR
ncbi:MAG: hypothetical protein ROO73_01705 [Roseivirga sp.]